MKPSQPTLAELRKSPKLQKKRIVGVADFVSEEELDELHDAASEGRSKGRIFDDVDAFCAEILARFGLAVYDRWNSGDENFSTEKMVKLLAAERARERAGWLPIENMIALASTVSVSKKPKQATRSMEKMLKREEKMARGES